MLIEVKIKISTFVLTYLDFLDHLMVYIQHNLLGIVFYINVFVYHRSIIGAACKLGALGPIAQLPEVSLSRPTEASQSSHGFAAP